MLILRQIDLLYKWWHDLKEFVSMVLDIEADVIFKHSTAARKKPLCDTFHSSGSVLVNGRLYTVIKNIWEYRDKLLSNLCKLA